MPNNEIFSGIPSLDDTQGLEDYLNQQAMDSMGLNTQIPAALENQQQTDANSGNSGNADPAQTAPTYTQEQIAQIIARNQQLEAQFAQSQQPVQPQQQVQQQQVRQAPLYNDRQIGIINQLLARGVSIEEIAAHIAKSRNTAPVNSALVQRLQSIESYLQQQQYAQAEAEFIQKMTTFGDKFGLSEKELEHFGNVALEKGINVAHVTDLEAVFRAIFPDQYALRVQRMSNPSTSQFYGGASAMDTPRASASKMEDAYVDAFLKQTMPNQYGRKN